MHAFYYEIIIVSHPTQSSSTSDIHTFTSVDLNNIVLFYLILCQLRTRFQSRINEPQGEVKGFLAT